MQKIYVAQRPGDDEIGDCRVSVVSAGGVKPLRHVVYHSPTGLAWGYAGSGPADLALPFWPTTLESNPPMMR